MATFSILLVTKHQLKDFHFHCCCLFTKLCPNLFATPWTVACQAPLSGGFSKQEYRGGSPRPPPGDLPDPEIGPLSPVSCVSRWVLYHWCDLGKGVDPISFPEGLPDPRIKPMSPTWQANSLPLSHQGKLLVKIDKG